jgi:predicted P-loop ATPase
MPRLDVFADQVVWPDGSELKDVDALDLVDWLMSQPAGDRVRVGKDTAFDGIVMAAQANSYHPVRNYLDALIWDGKLRVDELCSRYFGAENTEYHRAVSRCFMLGCVERIRNPGCKFETVPVFEGKQGIKKSTALKILAGDWFSDTAIDLTSKDRFDALVGVWIYEMGELETLTSRADKSRLKNFISSPFDRYRPAYGRATIKRMRSIGFAGTTNEGEYLDDSTGARRWQPVRCGNAIDVSALARDRDQLWAEAVARRSAGEEFWMPKSMEPVAHEAAETRRQADPWEHIITAYAATMDGFTSGDVYTILALDPKDRTRAHEIRVAAILRGGDCRMTRVRVREGDMRYYRWYRKTVGHGPDTGQNR